MSLIISASIWLGSWVLIFILYAVVISKNKNTPQQDPGVPSFFTDFYTCKKEILADGNNLFITGLVYFLGTVACYLWNNTIFHWVCFIVGAVAALIPIVSWFGMLFDPVKNKFDRFMVFSAFLNSFSTAAMAFIILFEFILK